ncbi:MAG: hypothetical protein J6U15_00095, partial [Lachnospiraceae bacterium]|nr:hypothetical protein [Lachnospiraceae bacterium]
ERGSFLKQSDESSVYAHCFFYCKKPNETKKSEKIITKGAANCLALVIGHKGKAYRTGGDEFMAIVHTPY